jgi:acetyl esterase/lipase
MAPSRRPPFDAELAAALAASEDMTPATITPEMVPLMKEVSVSPPVAELLAGRAVTHRDVTLSADDGAELVAAVFARSDHRPLGPGILHVHGGGMIMGDRFSGLPVALDWVERFDAVCVSIEYRLPPQHPDPYPVEDCFAGLVWLADNADDLGVDPERLLVAGASAGGGLAAGTALLARDRGGPRLAGQVLMYPMLDDRNETVSARQYEVDAPWDARSNETGWDALLGDRRGTERVSVYAAPARATDLAGLPPTFIDVGSAEVFRDENVAYASAIWAAGGEAELHVWPGGFHGFDRMFPGAALSRAMTETRTGWLGRLLTRRRGGD